MKKENVNDPDNLGGLGDMLPAEVLKKLNELLEQLHQAGNKQQGSTVINIYEKGSLHVDHVDNQHFYGNHTPDPSPARPLDAGYQRDARKGEGNGTTLPEALSTEEARALWEKVQEAGYVDEHYQPKISRTQAALLANAMAKRLGIKEKWKVFEALWNRRNMYRDYQDALDQRQSSDFLDILKELF